MPKRLEKIGPGLKESGSHSRKGDVATVVLLLSVSFALFSLNSRPNAKRNVIDRAFLTIIASLQNTITQTVKGTSSLWKNYVDLIGLAEENQTLKNENILLKAEHARLALLEEEYDKLKDLLDFRQNNPHYLPARIIAHDSTPGFQTLMLKIDRGENEIEKGMAVVTPEGIVGQVFHVFGDYADVMLLIDPRSRIDILVERTRSAGTLKGTGSKHSYRGTIPSLYREDTIREGDLIVTSGLAQIFPKGLSVGTIIKIHSQSDQAYQEAIIQPVVDLSRIEYVFVITTLHPPPPLLHNTFLPWE